MIDNTHILMEIEDWYKKQCNGEWEHAYGITIGTLDNPGWEVTIDLKGTALEQSTMEPIVIERSDKDWLHCKVDQYKFNGYGGSKNLNEIIGVFLAWTKRASN